MFDSRQVLRHILFAVIAGVVGACASILLCLCANAASTAFAAHPQLIFLLPVAGYLTLLLYGRMGLALDLTTGDVLRAMRDRRRVSPLLAPGILIATSLSLLCGASVGKEAGALQMGASLGDAIGGRLGISTISRKRSENPDGYCAALGMAATFSALFFTPLGSVALVLEKSGWHRNVIRHAPSILLACFIGAAISGYVGIGDHIARAGFPVLDVRSAVSAVFIGVVCALCGCALDILIKGLQRTTKRISDNVKMWVFAGGVIIAAAVTVFGWSRYCGTGSDLLADAFAGRVGDTEFAVKALLTALALGFWFKGGEIMPSLTVGALLGAALGTALGADAGFGAALGMMAFFGAFANAPLAAALMGCEVFGWSAAPLFVIGVGTSALVNAGLRR